MSDTTFSAALPRPLAASLARARAWFVALSRPARLLLMVTSGLAVAFGGFVMLQRANEAYLPLFSQLDREDAAAIVVKLKELKVPYRVDSDGATIQVPESRARELRLELAGSGLPRGGSIGFESFDKMRLGATDFEQRVLYRRALEGELTRTIGTLGAVESARVHLVLPEKSVFITRGEPASASIMLRLRSGRSLGPSEVAGVVHLVASAVPGLQADRIAVVTTDGMTLHRPRKTAAAGDEDSAGGEEESQVAARSYETLLEERVRAMLERVVGPGHADVRVTAEIDPARVERLEEHYDPTKSVLRSEEQSTERGVADANESVAGVPGAESNLPTGSAKGSSAPAKPAPSSSGSAAPQSLPVASAAVSGAVRESHTRNYEVDHVSEKRTVGGGALKRLTVAVVLDGIKGDKGIVSRSREDLDKLATLVSSAAGASQARGDVVSIESIPFATPAEPSPGEATASAPATLQKPRFSQRLAPPLAVAAATLLAFGAFILRRRRAKARAAQVLQLAAPEASPLLEAAVRPMLDSGDLRTQALDRATQDPASAALVLRFWLGTAAAPDARDVART